ncbi:nucleotidyltransferase [Rhodococcus sp. WS1]|uniref:SMODS domain-containing nucleotidyltransferase n=1 Tax=unclassified Rhodococcus (in: high G+C Gram-positive bacteria) TaxID=192944 RepID=UPI00114184C0|nr:MULTISPECIES: nucleotidyltransferase [unclassified Rhodococcus (in: high G+C Gram-positive bacteria)]ROZ52976.1 nucleotidyltransferase [Rhodococcus sp. WS1]TQC36068.1 nucleotidyltransferase [Rhodococcus sp. WS7]
MSTNAHFEAFLESTVNLKPWKLTQLDSHVQAIVNALQKDSIVGPMYKEHIRQGSWAHETIINPVGPYDQFDADFLLHLEENDDWSEDPGAYLRELRAAFKRHTTYAPKVKKKNRCVRIDYANECHVDVVPHLTLANGREVIVNYADATFEDTNPAGFTEWMKERDDLTGGNLRKVLRLLKYLRDYKNTFDCKSVILTTLVGGRIQPYDLAARYSDIPSTFVAILNDLDTYLDLYPTMPLLDDPSCPGTSFNHRWTEEKYTNFKSQIKRYAEWAREAHSEEDEELSIKAWQKLFGPEFIASDVTLAKSAILASGRNMNNKALVVRAPNEQFIEEKGFVFSPRYTATIVGKTSELYGALAKTIRSGRKLRRGLQLEFRVRTDAPKPYEVIWKVRNHGEVAEAIGQLRGELIAPNRDQHRRVERTLYPGRHFIEVYIVVSGIVVASDHHEVVIE